MKATVTRFNTKSPRLGRTVKRTVIEGKNVISLKKGRSGRPMRQARRGR